MGTERGSHQPSPAPVTGPGLCPGSVGTQHPWMAGPSYFHGQGPSQLFTKPLPGPPPTDPQVDAHPSMKPPHPKPSGAQGCLGPNTTGCTSLGSLGKLCPLFPQEQGAVCREGQRCGRPVHSTTPAPCAEVTPDPQTPPRPSDLRDRGAAAGARAMGVKSHHWDRDMGCRGVQQCPLSPLLPPSLCPCLLQH